MDSLNCIIPRPVKIEQKTKQCLLSKLKNLHYPAELAFAVDSFLEHISPFRDKFPEFCRELNGQKKVHGSIAWCIDKDLPPEGYCISIEKDYCFIAGGTPHGVWNGTASMIQLMINACSCGGYETEDLQQISMPTGKIYDHPRFEWRGFMLDSARHFQKRDEVLKLLKYLSIYKINTFHWHLMDNQGCRIPLPFAPQLANTKKISPGCYSEEDIHVINEFAKKHFIKIVPEIEMPSHSRSVIDNFPEFACNPQAPSEEYCLANPEAKEFIKKIIHRTIELFPASEIIHLGGDEACVNSWQKCSKCHDYMKKNGIKDERLLEQQFMHQMAEIVSDAGLTPMVWATSALPETNTIVQSWHHEGDANHVLLNGSSIVNSLHEYVYFDYPENSAEPSWNSMPVLDVEKVYQFDPIPCGIETEDSKNVLGGEACLWTERIPAFRIQYKTQRRLMAFAETVWSFPEIKSWKDFERRQKLNLATAVL